ncbi:MAG TPA: hypothetical protein VEC13_02155, partial [Candidatus Paceibacterota bacterium]|nr:hypothetical protein [Candidatus Paceibacterota bacterium]
MSAEAALSGVMSQMVSSFNLISGKPNVQFFEGEEGIKEVLNDSLQSSEEILTYLDIEALMTTLPKENEWYVSQRAKLGIKKRGLVLDSPFNRKFLRDYHKEITDTRFLSCSGVPFNTIMQIYDNKVSYITISNTIRIGVIIEDPNIYTMHKFLFNCLWEKSQKINE